ncbi:SRPBCC family protein [Halomonas sp. HP20-15]|uniref:SRPBCC family protein n=1 Tax=Halomonas sp. HP20-15 TaxID=3085901 RepID=UPI0029819205|nr:SRPBCC family protein [Halomonas sp. HP20-15]MDW5377522.1 SRPBCC family protein [Halomonas sp. HP20-15]
MTDTWQDDSLVAMRSKPASAGRLSGRERTFSILGGCLCVGLGMRRHGIGRLAHLVVGGMLLSRGAAGYCSAKKALSANSYEQDMADAHDWKSAKVTSRSVTIDKPREEIYRFWRDFTNLAQFMKHIERVDVIDARRSHWVASPAPGKHLEWDAEITDERENEYIAWQTEENSDIHQAGWVSFRDAPRGRGTVIQAVFAYEPPAGYAGHAVAKLLGRDPGTQTGDDLRRLKQLLEIGEITTNAARPGAQRGGR